MLLNRSYLRLVQYLSQVAAANVVDGDDNATVEDVTNAYKMLHEAIMKLRRTPDKSVLPFGLLIKFN